MRGEAEEDGTTPGKDKGLNLSTIILVITL